MVTCETVSLLVTTSNYHTSKLQGAESAVLVINGIGMADRSNLASAENCLPPIIWGPSITRVNAVTAAEVDWNVLVSFVNFKYLKSSYVTTIPELGNWKLRNKTKSAILRTDVFNTLSETTQYLISHCKEWFNRSMGIWPDSMWLCKPMWKRIPMDLPSKKQLTVPWKEQHGQGWSIHEANWSCHLREQQIWAFLSTYLYLLLLLPLWIEKREGEQKRESVEKRKVMS